MHSPPATASDCHALLVIDELDGPLRGLCQHGKAAGFSAPGCSDPGEKFETRSVGPALDPTRAVEPVETLAGALSGLRPLPAGPVGVIALRKRG